MGADRVGSVHFLHLNPNRKLIRVRLDQIDFVIQFPPLIVEETQIVKFLGRETLQAKIIDA